MMFKLHLFSNEMAILKFLNSPACKVHPYACQSKMKFEQYQLEIQYILKVFHAVHKKFLTAIDHINYHPSWKHNATRMKRSETYNLYGHYHTQTRILTPSEENFLDKFMKALLKQPISSFKATSMNKLVEQLWGHPSVL